MEYSVASYIERRRNRHNQKINNNICSDSESESASKKNSVTVSSIFPAKGNTQFLLLLIRIKNFIVNFDNINILY